jgi:hypothetical protein
MPKFLVPGVHLRHCSFQKPLAVVYGVRWLFGWNSCININNCDTQAKIALPTRICIPVDMQLLAYTLRMTWVWNGVDFLAVLRQVAIW